MKKILLIVLILLMSEIIFYAQQAEPFKVIVNASNPVTELTKKDVSKMFMKKLARWENGTPVLPVDQVESSSVRKQFSEAVLGKTVSAVKSYWQEQIFSGKGVPPPEKTSDKEVIDYVKANAGAIGYVSADASLTGVKAVEVKEQ